MAWRIEPVLIIGLLTMLPGCVLPRSESEPVRTYQLSLDEGPRNEATGREAVTGPILLVGPPQASPGFDTPRMAYLKRRYELEYYAVNQWADAPARMLAPLLVESLSREQRWRAVVPVPATIRGDYRLDTSGFVLQQEFLQQPSRVRVSGRVQLIDLKDQRIMGTRAVEAVEEAATDDAYGGVVAANRAVAKWLDQVATWTAGCVANSRNCAP